MEAANKKKDDQVKEAADKEKKANEASNEEKQKKVDQAQNKAKTANEVAEVEKKKAGGKEGEKDGKNADNASKIETLGKDM